MGDDNKILRNNDAEIGGLTLGTLLRLKQGEAPPGSAEWAAEKAILERYDSVEDFQDHLKELDPEQQQGLISLYKGRAAEHLVAYDTGGEVHENWSIPAHDIITPEGDHIQAKPDRWNILMMLSIRFQTESKFTPGPKALGSTGCMPMNGAIPIW